MSYNIDLQAVNTRLQSILDRVNSLGSSEVSYGMCTVTLSALSAPGATINRIEYCGVGPENNIDFSTITENPGDPGEPIGNPCMVSSVLQESILLVEVDFGMAVRPYSECICAEELLVCKVTSATYIFVYKLDGSWGSPEINITW